MPTLHDIPVEVLELVLTLLSPYELARIVHLSRFFFKIALPCLYSTVHLRVLHRAIVFHRIVEQDEGKALLVRSLFWDFDRLSQDSRNTDNVPRVADELFRKTLPLLKRLEVLRFATGANSPCSSSNRSLPAQFIHPQLKTLEYDQLSGHINFCSLVSFVDLHPNLTTLRLPLFACTPMEGSLSMPNLETFSGPLNILRSLTGVTRLTSACLFNAPESSDADDTVDLVVAQSGGRLKSLGCVRLHSDLEFLGAVALRLPTLQHLAVHSDRKCCKTSIPPIVGSLGALLSNLKFLVSFQYTPLCCWTREAPFPRSFQIPTPHLPECTLLRSCAWFGRFWRWNDNASIWEKVRAQTSPSLVVGIEKLAIHLD